MEGATHRAVVDLIKRGGDVLLLTGAASLCVNVSSVYGHVMYLLIIKAFDLRFSVVYSEEDADNSLEPGDSGSLGSPSPSPDYNERRILPITIPEYSLLTPRDSRCKPYIVYHLHMAGRHVCSRRYNEFRELDERLHLEFPDFAFPPLPSKWPFGMNEQRLAARRRQLETYIERVCSVRVIADSDGVQEFLSAGAASSQVPIPFHSIPFSPLLQSN